MLSFPLQGIIVAPTSLVMGTTLDCSFCTKNHCDAHINVEEDPGLNLYYVRRYCALEGPLSPIILYFPYILLIIATVLVMMDRLGIENIGDSILPSSDPL